MRTKLVDGGLGEILAIHYQLGDLRTIDEIDFLRDDRERLELYRQAGFENYSHTDLSMRELAALSALEALDHSGIPREAIGYCVYVAESFDRDELVSSVEVNRLLVDLGLGRTVPIHVSAANCANILAGIRIAHALIWAGTTDHVLVVSVDKASRRYGGRKMFQEISIKSDVSLSCIVCATGGGGRYRIDYLGQHNDAALACAEPTDAASYSVPKFRSIRGAANQAKDTLQADSHCFAKIITNNYSREVSKLFVELCGFTKESGYFDNIGRFAHAVAGDVLINLSDLHATGEVDSGDRVFMLSDSVNASSVLCVRVC